VNGYRCPAASIDDGAGAVPAGRGALRASAAEPGSGAGAVIQHWPLASYLPPLAALATAPACARGHVRALAREWGLADLADTAELLISELVTNAIRASDRLTTGADPAMVPVVRVWAVADQASMAIHVWDGNSQMPERRDAAPDEEGGRGLLLVDALGTRWGAYRTDNGKVVWVVIGGTRDPLSLQDRCRSGGKED
jgi:anti-sigma regulatory factor (Ser/Thr protein kinase)